LSTSYFIYVFNQGDYVMSKAQFIRDSLIGLNPYATNREVCNYCEENHGFTPTPQQIYEAIGSEKDRQAQTFNGRELMDIKRFARKRFDGDYNRLNLALRVVMSNVELARN
jgi:hypothetical protein